MSENNYRTEEDVEHIQESTLIPESHFSAMTDDPNEQVSVVPESSSSIGPTDQKPMAAALKKEQSFAKKNAPYIAVAAVAGVLVVAFAMKGMGGSSQPQVVKTPAAVVVEPTKDVASGPSGTSPSAAVVPVEINNPSLPGSPSALNQTEVVAVTPSKQEEVIASTPSSDATTVQEIQAPTATQAITSNEAVQITTNTENIDQLAKRVAVIEKTITPENASSANASGKKGSANRSRQDGGQGKTNSAKNSNEPTAVGYEIHIVRDNLAWINTPNGKTASYAIGDTIPGLGKLTKIDEHAHTAIAGKQKIK